MSKGEKINKNRKLTLVEFSSCNLAVNPTQQTSVYLNQPWYEEAALVTAEKLLPVFLDKLPRSLPSLFTAASHAPNYWDCVLRTNLFLFGRVGESRQRKMKLWRSCFKTTGFFFFFFKWGCSREQSSHVVLVCISTSQHLKTPHGLVSVENWTNMCCNNVSLMCVIFSTEMFHMFNSVQTHICIFFVTFFQINIINNNRYKTTGKNGFFYWGMLF